MEEMRDFLAAEDRVEKQLHCPQLNLDGHYSCEVVEFGEVLMGKEVSTLFKFFNPSQSNVMIVMERFPFDKGFGFHLEEGGALNEEKNTYTFSILPGQQLEATISFSAEIKDAGYRHKKIVNVKTGKKQRYQFSLAVTAVPIPEKKKKNKSSFRYGARYKDGVRRKAFGVVNQEECLQPKIPKIMKDSVSTSVNSLRSAKTDPSKCRLSQQDKKERALATWLNFMFTSNPFEIQYDDEDLNNYNFEVTKFANDFRDGVRLWKALECIVGDEISYYPILSEREVDWIENVKNFLLALKRGGVALPPTEMCARSIVKGEKPMIAKILWQFFFTFKISMPLDLTTLELETKALKRLSSYQSFSVRRTSDAHMFQNNLTLAYLFNWCRAICACHSIEITNFTTSWTDGRAFCALVSHFAPHILNELDVQQTTTETQTIFESQMQAQKVNVIEENHFGFLGTFSPGIGKLGGYGLKKLQNNEKINFKILAKAVRKIGGVPLLAKYKDFQDQMPNEDVVIAYVSCLYLRLRDVQFEVQIEQDIKMQEAARLIQKHVREWSTRKAQQRVEHLTTFAHYFLAAATIQHAWRSFIERKHKLVQEQQQKLLDATVTLQKLVRGWQSRQVFVQLKLKQEDKINRLTSFARYFLAATTIQHAWNTFKIRKQQQQLQLRVQQQEHKIQLHAAIVIQKFVRGWQARHVFVELRLKRDERISSLTCYAQHFLAAATIQHAWNSFKARKQQEHLEAAIVIQTFVRGWQARKFVCEMLAVQRARHAKFVTYGHAFFASVRIQRQFRAYLRQKYAAIVMQKHVRGWIVRREVNTRRIVRDNIQATVLQKVCRGFFTRAQLEQKMHRLATFRRAAEMFFAAVKIQQCFRAHLQHVRETRAAITIQRAYRHWIENNADKRQLSATICIQRWYRAALVRRSILRRLKKLVEAYRGIQDQFSVKDELSALRRCLEIKSFGKFFDVIRRIKKKSEHKMGRFNIAKHDGIDILLLIINSCNRSQPHMAVIKYCLIIIENLLGDDIVRDIVQENLGIGPVMFSLLEVFKKELDISARLCDIIHNCCRDQRHKEVLRNADRMHYLDTTVALLQRKLKLFEKLKQKEKEVKLYQRVISLLASLNKVLNS
eukprot:m.53130 g.53130  ORF g.53130 m.53130 type:complete len:1122 (+) comp7654_c0_seq2:148-3513(+)